MSDSEAPPPLMTAEAWFKRRISSKGNMTEHDEIKLSTKRIDSGKFLLGIEGELDKMKQRNGSQKFNVDAIDDQNSNKSILNSTSSHKLMKFFAVGEEEIKAVVGRAKSPLSAKTAGGDPQTDTDTDAAPSGGTGRDRDNSSPERSQKKIEKFFGGLDQGHVKERKHTKSYNKVTKLFDLEGDGSHAQVQ